MLEKIKITINKNAYNILLKDCENFGFYKNETELNKNLFFNTIILNYYDHFSSNEKSFKESISKTLDGKLKGDKDETIDKLLEVIRKSEYYKDDKEKEIINLKPTKITEKTIINIENNLSIYASLASYYRNLFTSYSNLKQNYRELIIFKENYNLILESIKKDKQVNIVLTNDHIINNASVYKISHSREELYNYVLISTSNSTQTIRLAKIKYITLTNLKRDISSDAITLFEKQIKYGVEYPLLSANEEPVIVRLNDKGLKLYKKIYLYRPTPDKIEGNDYYFYCSHNQIVHYFKRFGSNAIIISPNDLYTKMKNYYFAASKKYLSFSKSEKNVDKN